MYNFNFVIFNKDWFIVKKKKIIYIMGDLVTCPRYLFATLRKKKENTQTLIKKKKSRNEVVIHFFPWLDDNGAIISCELNYCKT